MKKLFGREKPSLKRPSFEEDPPARPYALTGSHSSSFSSLPPNPPAVSPIPSPFAPRAASPFSTGGGTTILRKKAPGGSGAAAAVGILKALDPHLEAEQRSREISEDHHTHHEHPVKEEKKDKKPFWERSSGKEKEKDYDVARDRRDEDGQAELTRMIGKSNLISSIRSC